MEVLKIKIKNMSYNKRKNGLILVNLVKIFSLLKMSVWFNKIQSLTNNRIFKKMRLLQTKMIIQKLLIKWIKQASF